MTPEEIERRKDEAQHSFTAKHGGKIAAACFVGAAVLIGLSWYLFR